MKIMRYVLAAAWFVGFSSFALNEAPQSFTLDGRIFNSPISTVPLTEPLTINIKILDPNAQCVLYEEQQNYDTSDTDGYFNIRVGSSVGAAKRYGNDPGHTMDTVFQNRSPIVATNVGCTSPYSPAAGDSRLVRISVTSQVSGSTQIFTPDLTLDSTPIALVAQSVSGLTRDKILELQTSLTLTQGNVENVFSAVNYPKLVSLLNGTSNDYVRASPVAPVGMNGQRITNVAEPTAASDAATKNYADSTIGGKSADTTVLAGLGAGDASKIMIWDGTKWTAATNNDVTKLPLAGGTMSGAINMNGNNILGTGHITMSPLTTLNLGTYSNAAETTLIGTFGVGPAAEVHKGKFWYNTDLQRIRGWNGTSAVTLAQTDEAAGGDLQGTFPNPTLKDGVVTSAKIADGTITGADIASGTVADSNIISLAINKLTSAVGQYFNYKPNGAACANGQTLKWNDIIGGWECGADSDTGITQLTGDVTAGPGSGSQAATISNSAVTANKIADGAVTTSKLFTLAGINQLVMTDSTTGNSLEPRSCFNGQVLAYNLATGWECKNPTDLVDGSVIRDGGNARGADVMIGTTDNFALGLKTDNTTRVLIDTSGNVGIGTSVPLASLDVSSRTDALGLPRGTDANRPGSAIGGMIRFNTDRNTFEIFASGAWQTAAIGTTPGPIQDGQSLRWNNTTGQFDWYAPSSVGVSSINGDSTSAHTIVTDSSGSDFAINTLAGQTTISIPTASGSARGLLSTTDWTSFNAKLDAVSNLALLANGKIWVGDIAGTAQEVTLSGDVTMTSSGVVTIANSAVGDAKISDVNVAKISSGLGSYFGYQPNGSACAPGDFLKWNNVDSRWECGTLSAGSVNTTELADDSVTSAKIAAATITGADIAANTVDDSNIIGVSVDKISSGASKYLNYQPNGSPCADNEVLRWSTDKWVCGGTFVGYVSLVEAGTGLTGGAITGVGTIGIASGGVGTTQLADDSVIEAKILNNAVTDAKINDVSASKITSASGVYFNYQPNGNPCVPGEALIWSNNRWECGPVGSVTQIEAGTGLTGGVITGVGTITIASGGVGTTQLADASVTTDKINDGAITDIKINDVSVERLTFGAGTYFRYQPNGSPCGAQEVLKWNDVAIRWECGTDNVGTGTVTQISAGNGLFGGPITTSGTLSVDTGVGPNKIPQFDASGFLGVNGVPSVSLDASANSDAIGVPRGNTGNRPAHGDGYLRYDSEFNGLEVSANGTWQLIAHGPMPTATEDGKALRWNDFTKQFEWFSPSSGAITSINGDTTSAQSFATDALGTDFSISTTGGVTTFSLPNASGSARGLLTSADYTLFNGKLSAVSNTAPLASGKVWIGDAGGKAQEQTLSGDMTVTSSGVATIASNAITTSKINNGAITTAKLTTGAVSANQIVMTDGTTGANLVTKSCADNEILKWNTLTGWQCAADSGGITQLTGDVTAGPGSGSVATTIAANAITDSKVNDVSVAKITSGLNSYFTYKPNGASCTNGQALIWDNTNGRWICGAGGGGGGSGTVTSVATGTGLIGGPFTTTGTISIATGGVSANELAADAVTSAKISDGSVATADLAASAVTDAKINDVSVGKLANANGAYFNYKPNNQACGDLQILAWDNTNGRWVCAVQSGGGGGGGGGSGTVVNVATGTGLTGGPVTFSGTISIATGGVTTTEILDNTIAAADLAASAVTDAKVNDVGYGKLANGANVYLTYRPNNTACTNNQSLIWDALNSRWVCGVAASGTVTNVATGTGLTGGPITGTGTISIASGGVTNTELANSSVDSNKIIDGSISISDINTNAIDSSRIIDGSIVLADLNNGSVDSSKILDSSIVAADLNSNSVTDAKINDVSYGKLTNGVNVYFRYQPNNSACANNQTLSWDNGNGRWVCATGASGTVTSVATGPGLTGGPITGAGTISIAAGGVSATELATDAVTSTKILDGTIALVDMGSGSVDSNKIVDGSVSAADMNNGAVNSAVILDGSIALTDMGSGAVNSAVLLDGSVALVDMASGAVNSNVIVDGSVSLADLNNDSVNSNKILDGSVSLADHANNSVDSPRIVDGSILAQDLNANSVTDVKINDVSYSKLNNGVNVYLTYRPGNVACTNLQVLQWDSSFSRWVCATPTSGTVTSVATGTGLIGGPITSAGTISIASGGVSATELATDAVTSLKILDGTIVLADLSTGSVDSNRIVDSSVSLMDLSNNSVDSSKIVDSSIGLADLNSNSVDSAKILDASVSLMDLNNNSVDSNKIVDGSVGLADHASNSVDSSKLVDGSVSLADLNSNSVDSSKLVDLSVSLGDMNSNSVDSSKIVDGSVSLADLNNGAVDSAKILDLSIASVDLGTNAVIDSKINDVTYSKLTSASNVYFTYRPNNVACTSDQVLSWDSVNARWRCASDGGGTVTSIGTGTGLTGGPITTTGTISIAVGGVTATELAADAVTSVKILNGTINLVDMAPNSVDTSALIDLGVQSADLNDGAVTTIKILDSNVTLSKLASASVDSSKIVDGTIATQDLANSAVTDAKINDLTYTKLANGATVYLTYRPGNVPCSNGYTLVWDTTNSRWSCSNAPPGTVLSVATGTGLTGGPITSMGTISIAPGGVSVTEIADDAVNSAKILDGAVSLADLNTGSVDSTKIVDGSIALADLNSNSVNSSKIVDSSIANADLGALAVTDAKVNDISYTKLTSAPGVFFNYKPSNNACGNNYTMVWDDANQRWACSSSVVGTITSISTGTGLIGGPITTSGTISIVAGGVGNTELATGAVDSSKINDGTVALADMATNSIDSAKIIDLSIATSDIASGAVTDVKVNDLSYAKLMSSAGVYMTYRPGGTACGNGYSIVWDNANMRWACTAGPDGTVTSIMTGTGLTGGPITTSGTISIASSGVTNLELATDAVTSTKIFDGTIALADLASNSVNSARIVDGSVSLADMDNNSVDSTKVVDGSLSAVDFADGAVTNPKLFDGSVSTTKLADNSVTSAKIAPNQVVSLAIADGTIATLDLEALAVTDAKVNDVGYNKLINGVGVYMNYRPNNVACTSGFTLVWDSGMQRWACSTAAPGSVTSISTASGLTGGPITGAGTISIASGGVNLNHLASNSVDSSKIVNGSVGLVDIGLDSVDGSKIVDLSVATADLGSNAVTSAKILDGAIVAADLNTDSVDTTKILDGTVGSSDLASNSIDSTKIIDLSVLSGDIADNAILTAKISDGNVTTAKLADFAVTNVKIASGAVDSTSLSDGGVATVDLAALAVTDAKINDISYSKFTNAAGSYFTYRPANVPCGNGQALMWDNPNSRWVCSAGAVGTVTSIATGTGLTGGPITAAGTISIATGGVTVNELATDAVTSIKILDGTVSLADLNSNSVDSSKIADGTVGLSDLASASVDSSKIVDGSVTLADHAASSVNSSIIVDGSVSLADINSNAVDSSKIVDGSVSLADLNNDSVNSNKILDGSVSWADLNNGSVDTNKIVDGSVSLADLNNGSVDTNKIVDGTVSLADHAASSVNSSIIVDGSILAADISNLAVTDAKINDMSYAKLLNASGAYLNYRPNNTPCTTGQSLVWDNANGRWSCSAGALGTVTQIATGTGLTGGPISTTGTISIAANGVTGTELAANAVDSSKINDGTVSLADLAANSVDNTKIADGTVVLADLASASVDSTRIVDGSVSLADMDANSVDSSKIQDASILLADMANGAVNSGIIFDLSVSLIDLNSNSVDSSKLVDGSVSLADMNSDSVNASKIVDGSVGTLELGALAVTDAKVNDITYSKLANGSGVYFRYQPNNTACVTGQSLVWDNLNNRWNCSLGALGTVTSISAGTGLSGGTITTSGTISIASGGVTATQLADNAVTSTKILDATIQLDDLAAGSVDSSKIMDGNVTLQDMADDSVNSAKIIDGSVSLADLNSDSVNSAKILDLSVGLADMNSNSVDSSKIVDGSIATIDLGALVVTDAKINDILVSKITSTGGAYFGYRPNNVACVNGANLIWDDGNSRWVCSTGVAGTVTSITAGTGLAGGIITTSGTISIAAGGVSVTELATDAVTSTKILDGTVALADLANNSVDSVKITDGSVALIDMAANSVDSGKIVDASILTADLANDSVTTVNILDANVTTAKLADSSISSVKLQDGAVTSSKILDGTVALADLASDSVDSDKIMNSSVSNLDLANDAVDTLKILDGGIGTADLGALIVTNSKLADLSVGATKLMDGSVTNSKIAAASVDSNIIADGTIAAVDIGNLAINDLKINDMLYNKLTNSAGVYFNYRPSNVACADGYTLVWSGGSSRWECSVGALGTVTSISTGTGLVGGTITTSGTISIAAGGVGNAQLATDAVMSTNILDGTITLADMASSSVDTGSIVDLTIATGDIANFAITTVKLNDGAVTAVKLADNSVTNAKLGADAVTSAKISDGTIVAADLASSSVTDVKVNDVSYGKLLNGANVYLSYRPNNAACVDGGAMVWDNLNSRWICSGGALGTVTSISAGTGLAGGIITTSGTISIASNGVTVNELAADAVTSAKISDGAIATADLANSSVTSVKIADGNVLLAKMASDSVDGAKIVDLSVTLADLASASVNSAKIVDASVSLADLNTGSVDSSKILDLSIATADLAASAVTDAKINDMSYTKLVNGAGVYLSYLPNNIPCTDGYTLVWNNTASRWQCSPGALGTVTSVASGSGLTGGPITGIGTLSIANSGIVTTMLNDGAVTSAKISDGSVSLSDMAASAVNSSVIQDGSIVAADINTGAVDSTKILDTSVSLADMNTGAVNSAVILDSSIVAADISNLAITDAKVNDVSYSKLLNAAGVYFTYRPNNVACTAGQGLVWDGINSRWSCTTAAAGTVTLVAAGNGLQGGSITGAGTLSLAAGGVSTTELANDAVTSAKISDGQVASADLAADSVNSAKIADGTVSLNDHAANSVDSSKIVDGSVALADHAASSVNSSHIVDFSVATADLATGAVTSTVIADGTIAAADIAASAVTDVKISDVGVGKITSGAGLYFTYRPNGTACTTNNMTLVWDTATSRWNCSAAAVGSVSSVTTGTGLTGGPITGAGTISISSGGVSTTEILDGTIAAGDLAADSVTSAKISDGQIATADLANDSVTTAKILDGTITTSDILDNTITSTDILDATIATVDLINDAVTSVKISDGTIVTADLANDAVTSAKIQDSTITTSDIQDATVATADLANSAVTDVKISTVSVSKITSAATQYFTYAPNGGTCSNGNTLVWNGSGWICGTPSTGSVTSISLGASLSGSSNPITTSGTISIAAQGVGTAELADDAVTSAKILAGTISLSDLASNSVDSNKIQDGTIALADLAADSVNSSKIADTSIATNDLAALAVTDAKINDVTYSKLTGGTGIYLTYRPGGSACANGETLVWNTGGSNWVCGAMPTGTVTNIVTGTGLTGGPISTAGTISLANGGVTSAHILDGTIALADLDANWSAGLWNYAGGNVSRSGKVGIGMVPSTHELEVTGSIYASNDLYVMNRVGVNTTSPGYELDVNGDLNVSGNTFNLSDRRLKKDIQTLDGAMGRLNQIRGVSFRMIADPKGELRDGVIAQEVEPYFPELVDTGQDEMKTKTVNYIGFIGWLIEAVKELYNDITGLKAENVQLKKQVNDLEQRLKLLEDRMNQSQPAPASGN